jgi:hypothetical protein
MNYMLVYQRVPGFADGWWFFISPWEIQYLGNKLRLRHCSLFFGASVMFHGDISQWQSLIWYLSIVGVSKSVRSFCADTTVINHRNGGGEISWFSQRMFQRHIFDSRRKFLASCLSEISWVEKKLMPCISHYNHIQGGMFDPQSTGDYPPKPHWVHMN